MTGFGDIWVGKDMGNHTPGRRLGKFCAYQLSIWSIYHEASWRSERSFFTQILDFSFPEKWLLCRSATNGCIISSLDHLSVLQGKSITSKPISTAGTDFSRCDCWKRSSRDHELSGRRNRTIYAFWKKKGNKEERWILP